MLSSEALAVLKARYLMGNESPADMFLRVARHVAQAEGLYGRDKDKAAQEYYQLMSSLTFLPNSPALINAGKPRAQMAACFVLPVEDSLTGIFETLKNAALVHQSGGGTGFAFSRLRPKGDKVASTGGTASGPISFMHVYNAATEVVRQGAARRGANMAVLRVDHPDIMEFITAKRRQDVLNNFNLSVGVTDIFMQAVEADTYFDLVNPRTAKVYKTIKAKEIFSMLVRMAWENGEPGLVFLDTINRTNPTPHLGEFEAPNPCSEQPLLPYESCVLGSINLTKVLAANGTVRAIDHDVLRGVVRTAVRLLDNIVDINDYPLPEVREATLRTRKIGLGIMGLAEVFIMLGISYASQAAVDLTGRIMEFITAEARNVSKELAAERGAFPAYSDSIYAKNGVGPVRNATVTTIAPTGTISIIAGCSSGIEPLFGLSMVRRVLDGQLLTSINGVVLAYLNECGLLTKDVLAAINKFGSVQNAGLPPEIKEVLAIANEIAPGWHVAHLAAAQRYTDNGVSKTVNLPQEAACEDVADIFFKAYLSGCKGVTVYRNTSRDRQVIVQGVSDCEACVDRIEVPGN